ncbi:MAG TPA: substrate-binding domain-containing protein [Arachidicoccus sp.]
MIYQFRRKIRFFFRTIKFLLIFSVVLWSFSACKHKKSKADIKAHPQQGNINICVDESFEPVISQQILVFQSSYPDAHIHVTYEPESDCFKDFQRDSTAMIVVARGLSEEESRYYNSVIGHRPRYSVLAFDAVAVVINAEAQDSVFSVQQLEKILTDKVAGSTEAILDGENATSTVRYLIDSITRAKPFGANVHGVKGSKAVLDAVAANKNAIGFIGSSWIGNNDDPQQAAYAKKVHLAYIENKNNKDSIVYAKPSQATIFSEQYPLVRTLYCVLKDDYEGLGTSFYNFMSFQRGQLIFRVGNLVPAKMNFTIRTVNNDTGSINKK